MTRAVTSAGGCSAAAWETGLPKWERGEEQKEELLNCQPWLTVRHNVDVVLKGMCCSFCLLFLSSLDSRLLFYIALQVWYFLVFSVAFCVCCSKTGLFYFFFCFCLFTFLPFLAYFSDVTLLFIIVWPPKYFSLPGFCCFHLLFALCFVFFLVGVFVYLPFLQVYPI